MSSKREECQEWVNKAADYVMKLSQGLSQEQYRILLGMPGNRAAEEAMNTAAIAEDVGATKAACRAWWEAVKVDMGEVLGGGEIVVIKTTTVRQAPGKVGRFETPCPMCGETWYWPTTVDTWVCSGCVVAGRVVTREPVPPVMHGTGRRQRR